MGGGGGVGQKPERPRVDYRFGSVGLLCCERKQGWDPSQKAKVAAGKEKRQKEEARLEREKRTVAGKKTPEDCKHAK